MTSLDPQKGLPEGTWIDMFEIRQKLGGGGFGITYLAREYVRGSESRYLREVALKEFFPRKYAKRVEDSRIVPQSDDVSTKAFYSTLKAFMREAEHLVSLDHPSIIKVYQVFESHGTAYYSMQRVVGLSLNARLRQRSTLSEQELLRLALPLLEGIGEAHAENVIHRDIKPDNIMVRDKDGLPILIDFGSSKRIVAEQLSSAKRKESELLVSDGFSATEQYSENEPTGTFTDVYSLCATFYACVTGITPPSALNRIIDTAQDRPDPLIAAVRYKGDKQYSADLLATIDWGLSLKSSDRPQTVKQLKDALTGALVPPRQVTRATRDAREISPGEGPAEPPDTAARVEMARRAAEEAALRATAEEDAAKAVAEARRAEGELTRAQQLDRMKAEAEDAQRRAAESARLKAEAEANRLEDERKRREEDELKWKHAAGLAAKTEEDRKRREAEARAAEEERKRKEVEALAAEVAKRAIEEAKRKEAEARAAEEARKRRESEDAARRASDARATAARAQSEANAIAGESEARARTDAARASEAARKRLETDEATKRVIEAKAGEGARTEPREPSAAPKKSLISPPVPVWKGWKILAAVIILALLISAISNLARMEQQPHVPTPVSSTPATQTAAPARAPAKAPGTAPLETLALGDTSSKLEATLPQVKCKALPTPGYRECTSSGELGKYAGQDTYRLSARLDDKGQIDQLNLVFNPSIQHSNVVRGLRDMHGPWASSTDTETTWSGPPLVRAVTIGVGSQIFVTALDREQRYAEAREKTTVAEGPEKAPRNTREKKIQPTFAVGGVALGMSAASVQSTLSGARCNVSEADGRTYCTIEKVEMKSGVPNFAGEDLVSIQVRFDQKKLVDQVTARFASNAKVVRKSLIDQYSGGNDRTEWSSGTKQLSFVSVGSIGSIILSDSASEVRYKTDTAAHKTARDSKIESTMAKKAEPASPAVASRTAPTWDFNGISLGIPIEEFRRTHSWLALTCRESNKPGWGSVCGVVSISDNYGTYAGFPVKSLRVIFDVGDRHLVQVAVGLEKERYPEVWAILTQAFGIPTKSTTPGSQQVSWTEPATAPRRIYLTPVATATALQFTTVAAVSAQLAAEVAQKAAKSEPAKSGPPASSATGAPPTSQSSANKVTAGNNARFAVDQLTVAIPAGWESQGELRRNEYLAFGPRGSLAFVSIRAMPARMSEFDFENLGPERAIAEFRVLGDVRTNVSDTKWHPVGGKPGWFTRYTVTTSNTTFYGQELMVQVDKKLYFVRTQCPEAASTDCSKLQDVVRSIGFR